MELSFDHLPDRQFYVIRFKAGAYETVPFISEIRFWGVERTPCPRLSTLAAMIALKDHPVSAITLPKVAINPQVCSALSRHFEVEIHPATYDINRRDLAGGEKSVRPSRLGSTGRLPTATAGYEILTWMSLDDLGGPLGGLIRTNIDAFALTELEKNLIVALTCSGKDVGHIAVKGADPELSQVFHRIGLELVNLS